MVRKTKRKQKSTRKTQKNKRPILIDVSMYFPNYTNYTIIHTLNISHSQLSIIPSLPKTIEMLDCSHNKIIKLPVSLRNTNCKTLFCNNNNIVCIKSNELPISIELLYCAYNHLSSLSIVSTLLRLSCANNRLRILPKMTNQYRIVTIDCDNNLLTELPIVFPPSLSTIFCKGNKNINKTHLLPPTILYCK